MSNSAILVIDDNEELRKLLRLALEMNGHEVFCTSSGQEGLNVLRAKKVDSILLDLMLPDGDGLTLIAGIKKLSDAPVIVISGKGNMIDKVVGLEMGADDYLSKPFSMEELGARVKANVRRYKGQGGGAKPAARPRITFGDGLVLDAEKFQVFDAKGNPCGLTTAEFQLLQALAKNAGRVMSREQILDAFRADSPNINDRAIDIQIARIRKKIGDNSKDPSVIKTIRGIGYILVSGRER